MRKLVWHLTIKCIFLKFFTVWALWWTPTNKFWSIVHQCTIILYRDIEENVCAGNHITAGKRYGLFGGNFDPQNFSNTNEISKMTQTFRSAYALFPDETTSRASGEDWSQSLHWRLTMYQRRNNTMEHSPRQNPQLNFKVYRSALLEMHLRAFW
jgi:hypothetical protein